MKKDVYINLFLDTRRKLKSGKYPVKLRVYTPSPKKQKLYATKYELSKREFQEAWNERYPKIKYEDLRHELDEVKTKGDEIIKKLPYFTFEGFERGLSRPTGDDTTIKFHYDDTIQTYKDTGSLGTANVYKLSQKSIKNYCSDKNLANYAKLQFYAIDKKWLERYENWMIERGASITTVSMYLRALRAVFNKAINEGSINQKIYPFKNRANKDGFEIQNELMNKRALTEQEKNKLLNTEPRSPEQQKAKDFWFLSYYCYGANMKDILLWKWENKHGDTIEYTRAKTRRTRRKNQKKQKVTLKDYSKKVIQKYSNRKQRPKDYIFNVINDRMTPEQKQNRIKNFTRGVNQQLKILAKANNLPGDISTYWARHTFTTLIVHAKAPLVLVKDLLGHASIQQTMTYVSSLEDDKIQKYLDKI